MGLGRGLERYANNWRRSAAFQAALRSQPKRLLSPAACPVYPEPAEGSGAEGPHPLGDEANNSLTMETKTSILDAAFKRLSSIRTGIFLLIVLVITAVIGTLIVQRPMARPGELERMYAPETLRVLNFFGLLDVFHSWWFTSLLALLALVIILASIERFPIAWRYFAHPYRFPDDHFVRNLPLQATVSFRSLTAEEALARASEAFRRRRLKPVVSTRQKSTCGELAESTCGELAESTRGELAESTRGELAESTCGELAESTAIFAEKYRFSRLAAYVVHTSLLMIAAGAIVDSIWGYRAFMALTPGETSQQAEYLGGTAKLSLPFAIRCDGTGQENYADGTPKRWWSRLAVLDQGKEVLTKEIAVNDPLTYRGVRFFQASYGSTGEAKQLTLAAAPKEGGSEKKIALVPGVTAPLDDRGAKVMLTAFVPDFAVRGNQIVAASERPVNPFIELMVEEPKREPVTVRLFPAQPEFAPPNPSSFQFRYEGVEMGYYTGLQLAREPGQWLIWAGCILLTVGLGMAFYFIHMRFWARPVSDDRGGPPRRALWLGGSASKNREDFEVRFRELVSEVRLALESAPPPRNGRREAEPELTSARSTGR